ncbi:MAG: hypothetical protein ACLUKN_04515 [Bacilli bacterium]
MYSTIDDRGLWQIDELDLDSKKVRNITPRIHDKIDNYDGVYLWTAEFFIAALRAL